MPSLRAPGARAHKHGVVAVTQQVVDAQGAADGGRGAHAHAQIAHHLAVALHQRARQTKVRNAVLQHAADLRTLLKHGDGAARLGQLDGHRDAGGAGTNDRHALAAAGSRRKLMALQVGGRDIVLDAREVNGGALLALNARALALAHMVAHGRADRAHGVVGKQHLARLIDLALAEQLDDLRNRRLHRTTLKLAHRALAHKAALGLLYNMYSHFTPSPMCSYSRYPQGLAPHGPGAPL